MKIFRTGLLLITSALIISSCQKELSFAEDSQTDDVGDTEIKGTWRFVGLRGTSITYSEFEMGGMSTQMNVDMRYISTQASGHINITNSTMELQNVAYEADAETSVLSYMDGDLIMDVTSPTPISFPATNQSNPITWISGDSIRLRDNVLLAAGQQPGMPNVDFVEMGAKFGMRNDTLILRFRDKQNIQYPDPNVTGSFVMEMDAEMLMLK